MPATRYGLDGWPGFFYDVVSSGFTTEILNELLTGYILSTDKFILHIHAYTT